MLSKLILTVSCPLLEAAGCFWLCLGVMLKSCFGILKGGGDSEGGTGSRDYGGDIVAAWVFSSSCWYRAKTPPTTEWFLPVAAMVNTSACSPSPPSVYYSLAPLVVTRKVTLFFGQHFLWLVNILPPLSKNFPFNEVQSIDCRLSNVQNGNVEIIKLPQIRNYWIQPDQSST